MTVRFKNELVRNITIKLGYANAKVRRAYFYFLRRLFTLARSINAKTRHVPDRVATGRIAPTKKTIRPANDLVVVTV